MNDVLTKLDVYVDMAIQFAPRILLAILVFVIGLRIIKLIVRRLDRVLKKKMMDEEIRRFLMSLVTVLLQVLLFFSAAEIVGVKTASFIAVLAAAGFAVGMALQGSLSNFAAGVMIIFFKPYRVGDIIQVGDAKGKVSDIQIFNTIMITPKNETVILPNATAIADKIINHSAVGNERVDVFFHIPYEQDFAQVQALVMEYLANHPDVLKEPSYAVSIEEYDSHNVKIGIFAFAAPDDYWKVFYSISNAIKPLLGQNGIKVAYSEGVELGAIAAS